MSGLKKPNKTKKNQFWWKLENSAEDGTVIEIKAMGFKTRLNIGNIERY